MNKFTRVMTIAFLTAAFSQPLYAADTTSSADSKTAATSDTSSSTTTSTTGTTKPGKTLSMSNLIQQLQKAGYIVKSIDFDKDNAAYKVDAVDRFGDKQSLDLNAATGLTPEQKKVHHDVSLVQIVKKLEKNGSYVKTITTDSTGYKATVIDSKGNSQDYTIDPQTGKVSQ